MTVKAEILDAMVASGCTAEQIAAVVKASMTRSTNAERQARFRQRAKASRVTENNVTGVTDNAAPLSDKEKSPTPPKEINSPPTSLRSEKNRGPTSLRSEKNRGPTSLRSEKNRGTRLSGDWALPAGWGRWALDQGYGEATIRREADKFADFWRSKAGRDAVKLDWEATWRNWMRNAPKSRHSGAPPPRPKSEFMQHQDDVQRELDKALGRKHDDEFTGNTLDLEAANWRAH